MRPLPLEPLPDAPAFVVGAALVRGEPIAVVDAGALLSGELLGDARRWITVRTGDERSVGLQVSSVIGVQPSSALELRETRGLLDSTDAGLVETLGRRDGELLSVLCLARTVADVPAPESA